MRGVGWGVVDQALSSASNVLFVLALARLLEPATFGFYVLGYTVLVAGLAVCRGGLGTMITLAATVPAEAHAEGRRALSAALLVGLPLGFGAALALSLLDTPVPPVLALALPVLLSQDVARISALAQGRPRVAAVGDGIWVVVSAGLLVVTWLGVSYPAPLAVGLWAAAGVVSLVSICAPLGLAPASQLSPLWAPHARGDRTRFAAEASVGALGSVSLTTAVTGLIGPVANAALRGAGTVVGPINVLITSLQVAVVPVMRRHKARGYRELTRIALPVVAVIGVCAVGVSIAGLALPSSIGELLLGESWVVVAPVLVVMGLEYAGQALLANGTTILRAQGDSRRLLNTRLAMTTLQITAGVGAAALFGSAVAVASASAGIVWLIAITLNLVLLRATAATASNT